MNLYMDNVRFRPLLARRLCDILTGLLILAIQIL